MTELSAARMLALEVGSEVRTRHAFASDVLDAKLNKVQLSAEDAAFARVLALGVAATWGTLDEVIDRVLRHPGDINDDARDALRVSTYEMVFLGKQPHAAVDQGVSLVRTIAPRATKVANFALRRVSETVKDFPFGDPATDTDALARLYGFPSWLCDALISALGRARAESFMEASNEQAPVFLGSNACACSDETVRDSLEEGGVGYRVVHMGVDGSVLPGAYRIQDPSCVGRWPVAEMLESGKVVVADASAQTIASMSLPEAASSPINFLEIGSGRGTKTILLQSHAVRMRGRPLQITCVDKHGFKADVLARRLQELHIPVARIISADATDLSGILEPNTFDACLVDAPCSGLGTLRRHPEIRWRLQRSDIFALADVSLALLSEAARYLRPGGRLTYSTCTVLPRENEEVVKAFLASPVGTEFDIVPIGITGQSRLTFQTDVVKGSPDAHFACVFRKRLD